MSILVQIGRLVRPVREPKESKKERKKDKERNLQTTRIDAAICGLACRVVFGR